MILEMITKNLMLSRTYLAQNVRHLLRYIYQKLKKMTTDFKQIVGNFRDILGNERDKLYPQMPNGREGDAHISITINMVIRRANPLRGFSSSGRKF